MEKRSWRRPKSGAIAMASIKTFQNQFVAAVVNKKPSETLLKDIIPGGKYTKSTEPIHLHRQGYIARLTEALGETFESIWWFLGDEEFFTICGEYISQHQSSVANLSNYGDHFIEFLKKHNILNHFHMLI